MSNIQRVFDVFFADFAKEHMLCDQQRKVAHAIMKCHTEAMGANFSVCEDCGHESVHYNSCRDRHCPSCQGISKDIWADKRCGDTVNAPYFHVVFTIPEQLHMLAYQNKKLLYGLMHKASAETVLSLARDKKYLGAKTGFFSVLHTWRQDLGYHPHIHIVLVGGGLDERGQWRSSGKKFFIPVKVLAKLFRGKFLAELNTLYHGKRLEFFAQLSVLKDGLAFKTLLSEAYGIDWYVYCKRAFSGPQAVVKYLAGYTHRIAIANSRILYIGGRGVTFNVRDRNVTGRVKPLTLGGIEFIRRFLMHVLPKGFVKIRYYGILAARNRKTALALCQKLTGFIAYEATLKGLNPTEVLLVLFGKDVTLCTRCGTGRIVPSNGLRRPP